MNKKVKKGLSLILLGGALSLFETSKLYSKDTLEAYSPNETYKKQVQNNKREDEGFTSEGLVYAGIITIGAYYILRRFSKSR